VEKALEMGKTSVTGSFQLFVGVATSTIIMAIGTIILARLILPEEYGLYSVALMPSYLIILFRDWGVNSAITRYAAHFRVINKEEETRNLIVAGLVFEIIAGISLSFLSLFLANFVAVTIFHRPESTLLISIASITIFAGALLTVSQATFIGFERMELNSFTIICQAIAKTIVSPLLVFFGFGAVGAVIGYTFSFLFAGIIGMATLYFSLFRKLKRKGKGSSEITRNLKTMLRYGVPLSMSSIISGFMAQFFSFMMAFFCSDLMIGNYQVAVQFAVILTFLTSPVSTVLFPTFAKLNPSNEQNLLKAVFASSVKYTALLLVPATMIMIILSEPIVGTLFGDKWLYAPFFLTLYVINNLFVIFGSLSMGSFLAGLGETKMLLKLSLLTLSCGLPLALLLIPTFGIVGVILGLLFAGLPSLIVGLCWIWKYYEAKADFKSSAKIFATSTFAAIITYTLVYFLNTAQWIKLVVGGIIFFGIYLFTAPLIGAVNKNDIINLKIMFSGLGIVSRLINIPLTLAEKATNRLE